MKKHELESRVAHLEAQLAAAVDGLHRLESYVDSPKFHGDDRVNVMDIKARVREALSDVADVEFEPWGLATELTVEREIRKNGHRHVISRYADGVVASVPRYLAGHDLREVNSWAKGA